MNDVARNGLTPDRFATHLLDLVPELREGASIVVGCSGGLDSMVLLHLLRFGPPLTGRLVVAHLDHAIRPESVGDARWVVGVCRAWCVDVEIERCAVPPASEAAAREARYAFLSDVRDRSGAHFVLTAHHADDQAETVLFRALRGSGIDGLAGIQPRRADGVVRPLLPWSRSDIARYAESVGLGWRHDSTNDDGAYARNVLRHTVLPRVEAEVAPGARRALARLADTAAADRVAWAEALDLVGRTLDVERTPASIAVDRGALAAVGPALRARLLRAFATDLGQPLELEAVRRAVAFADAGRSGTRIELGGGVVLARELDRLILSADRHRLVHPQEDGAARADGGGAAALEDRALEIASPVRGVGEAILGGRCIRVEWAAHTAALASGPVSAVEQARFSLSELAFPLTVRGRHAGDRIGLAGGTRPLRKVLLEARVPSAERDSVPLLVDASDRILWVPGVARARDVSSKGRALTVRIG